MVAGLGGTVWKNASFFTYSCASDVSVNWAQDPGAPPVGGPGVSGIAFGPPGTGPACGTYAFVTQARNGDHVYATFDGGTTYAALDPSKQIPDRVLTSIAFAPNDQDTAYVTVSGFDSFAVTDPVVPGHVFRTQNATDASPTWQNITPAIVPCVGPLDPPPGPGQPLDIPFNAVAIDPSRPSHGWFGTDIGLWRADNLDGSDPVPAIETEYCEAHFPTYRGADGGVRWTFMGPSRGIPRVGVNDIVINPATDRVVAFTYGRSAYALDHSTDVSLSMTPAEVEGLALVDIPVHLAVANNGPFTATNVRVGIDFDTCSGPGPMPASCVLQAPGSVPAVLCTAGTVPASGSWGADLSVHGTCSGPALGIVSGYVVANQDEADASNNAATTAVRMPP